MTDWVGRSTQNVSLLKDVLKRVSKIIVPPKEMLLSFSIGTFLTKYDVINRKFNTFLYTSLYENEQNERGISQWRLLYFYLNLKHAFFCCNLLFYIPVLNNRRVQVYPLSAV